MSWVAEVTSLAALWGRRLEEQGGAPVYGGGIWDGGGVLHVAPVTSSVAGMGQWL